MKYFATGVDAKTGKLALAHEIEAETIESALLKAYSSGLRSNHGRPVRVTHLCEQPDFKSPPAGRPVFSGTLERRAR